MANNCTHSDRQKRRFALLLAFDDAERYALHEGDDVTQTVTKISAIGTRGNAKGKVFFAKKDSSGQYVLNKKTPSNSIDPTNKAVNKVFTSSLTEAATLLATDDYLINLVDEEGTRALREFKKVKIEYAEV